MDGNIARRCITTPQRREPIKYQQTMIKFAFLHTFYPLNPMQVDGYPKESFGNWWHSLDTKVQIMMLDRTLKYIASLHRRQLNEYSKQMPVTMHTAFENIYLSPGHFVNCVGNR